MKRLAFNLVKIAVKAVIFAIPVAIFAAWAEIPATWTSVAFVLFCMLWSDAIDAAADRHFPSSSPDDPATAAAPKTVTAVLTPAEVAREARKLTPRAQG
jgi:hypothetical protein